MRRGAAFAIAKHSLRCDCWAVAGERNAPNSARAAETSRRMNPSPMTSGESLACNATRGQQRAVNSASVSHPHARLYDSRLYYSRRGLNFQVIATRPAVIRPLTRPTMGSVSTSAALAAQPIEENASAKVASRDEVWRRRNWLRRACTRNQSWIAVAEAALTMTAPALTAAWNAEAKASAAISGQKMTAIAISTTSIL